MKKALCTHANSETIFNFLILFLLFFGKSQNTLPCPFKRILSYQNPELFGSDIFILQNLLRRSPFVDPNLNLSSYYDKETVNAVKNFQEGTGLPADGIVEGETASILLYRHIDDGYKDDGSIPPGYLYKLYVPVYKNRSIEVIATLFDSKMTPLHKFQVRAHGQNNPDGEAMNQFCDSGSTPTGLIEFDLNSPEDDWNDFGPYPVNRAVQGLQGNAQIVISNIRDGILLHCTPGEWPTWNIDRDSNIPMINSLGCIHGHPPDILAVWQKLISLGVQMRLNTNGALPYPYKPQGILSIEQID